MQSSRLGRGIGIFAIAAVAMVPMALATAAFAADPGTQSTADVGTGDELIEQWAITNNTVITLTADITITTCEGDPLRPAGGSGIVVDGQGLFGITQECEGTRVLRDDGVEHVTLTGLTHFTGGFACGAGGGLYTNGSATVENSTVNDNTASTQEFCAFAVESDPVGGGVYTDSGPVTVVNSTFSHNHAELAGGGFAAQTGADVSGSHFDANSAGASDPDNFDVFSGAGFATLGFANVSGSSFQGNSFGDAEGACNECSVIGGGFFADDGAQVDGSTFADNTANCDETCETAGGAIGSDDDAVGVTGSSFRENSANCNDDCDLFGGAIYSPSVTASGSSFAGNFAGCDEDCDNEGGAIYSGDATVADSTFSDNGATCGGGCAAFGGAIATVGFRDDAGPDAQSYGPNATSFSNGWGDSEVSAAAFEQGADTIATSTFSGNTAVCENGECGASGGAVYSFNATSVSVDSSTFDHNVATYDGGAIVVFVGDGADAPPVSITNSTITQNTSGTSGAISAEGSAVSVAYDTIVQNMIVEPPVLERADGDVAANLSAADPTFFATIVALPIGGPNCDVDSPTSQGYNFSNDDTCGLDQATDKVNPANDPGLGALGANGGPTQTMLPQTGSPVIDAIPVATCHTGIGSGVTVDQRGVSRPQGPGCDIGAVEVEFVAPGPVPSPALVITPKFTG